MRITAAHGSGGRDSAILIDSVFRKHFANAVLDKMEDAAIVSMESDRIAFTTDSFVVTPLVFKGGDIGKLSICGTVNDLLAMGARPRFLTCGFILEEGLELELLDRIVESMAREAVKAGVVIAAGDTKVVEGSGGLFINTSGIGAVPEGREPRSSACARGNKILLSGSLGDHHACILSARMGVENGIVSDCACLTDVTEALFSSGVRVKAIRDVTRGGLATVLNELAAASDCVMEIDEECIPVKGDVGSFCALMGLDPLYMGNEGKLVAVLEGSGADRALEAVRSTVGGRDAAIIGEVTDGEPEDVVLLSQGVLLKTRIGGRRRLDVLYGEGLPRIC